MSMSQKLICDICLEETDKTRLCRYKKRWWANPIIYSIFIPSPTNFDMCADCLTLFTHFVEGTKKDKEIEK